MKAIIQRVSAAKVTVGDELISSIGRGLCVLVGITHSDTEKDVEYMYTRWVNVGRKASKMNNWKYCVFHNLHSIIGLKEINLIFI
ncbi:PREDICTED: D-tyrosyl-tRNA(Tyr) deacylase 1 isoform X3 [Bactrocera latifrons]|uniref:D-tyrosyl-tRNA(Tyr) deacylase 1 isoform X3 n=1 Tax=Bactrocera latifrons TaxID=174628 RepID=UPI0008DCABE6|nr:PREDICTED: D-tyrosyl-tRNA(Tyr) deacylase 1 isoform X3 [Bactrocera latifrons]